MPVLFFTLLVALTVAFVAGRLLAGANPANPKRSVQRADSARAALSRASQLANEVAVVGQRQRSDSRLVPTAGGADEHAAPSPAGLKLIPELPPVAAGVRSRSAAA